MDLLRRYSATQHQEWRAQFFWDITPAALCKDENLRGWFANDDAKTPNTGFFKFSDTTGNAELMTPREALIRWVKGYEELEKEGHEGHESVFTIFKTVREGNIHVKQVTEHI